jgi:hypothetical protein
MIRSLEPVKKRFIEFIEKAKKEYDLVVLDVTRAVHL